MSSESQPRPAALLDAVTVVLLPGLIVYLGFNAGGYFADTTGWATATLALVLAVRMAVSPPRLGRALLIAAAALALFALWTLLSGSWSGNEGRALIEFDRALLYLVVLLLFGSLADPRAMMRFLPIGLALAAVVICGAGFVTRALPEVWTITLPPDADRLAYPVTYANGLGILASLGIIACLHVASWDRERAAIRILAGAALPLLAATLVLTFSRGAILAGAVGLLLYVAAGRPRGVVTAILACAPFVLLAAHGAYDADLLATDDPTGPAAVDQGQELARTVGLSALGAAAVLALLLPPERRLARAAPPRPSKHLIALILVGLAGAVTVAGVVLVPDAIESLEQEFEGSEEAPTRERLTGSALVDLAGQNRGKYWRVSLDAFEESPLRGTGVGTFAKQWARDRPIEESVTEGHSVYIETLGELGIIGAGLILVLLATLAAPLVAGIRGERRALCAAGLALVATWMIHAGIDWDWELPVVTAWMFAFGGCALAAWGWQPRRPASSAPAPRVIGTVACLLVAVTPLTIAISQSRLDRSVEALVRGDCGEALRLAASASSALPPRAEPYEITAYCQSAAGEHASAIESMQGALDRDPNNWELRYGLAVVRAAGGRDPRGDVQRLQRLNPLEPLTRDAIARFVGDDPHSWKREAADAPLPFP